VIVRSAPFTAEIMACADRLKVIGRYGVAAWTAST
jgi:phosphoglycerate dehydrogenase-like enzyme